MRSLLLAIALLGTSQAAASVSLPAIVERCSIEQMRSSLIKGNELMIVRDWRSDREFVPFQCED